MTDTADLIDMTVEALKGRTIVKDNVFSPRDWPTWTESYPVILVQAPDEDKTSLGRNIPQFTTVATFKITARLQALSTPRDGAAVQLEDRLHDMRKQIERAIINDYEITKIIQQFPTIRSQMSVSAEGEFQLGELVMTVQMEFYQGPEDFYPVESDPLQVVSISLAEPSGTTEPSIEIKFPQ